MKKKNLFLLPPIFENLFFIYGVLFLDWPPFLIVIGYIIEALFFPLVDQAYILFSRCTYKYEFFLAKNNKYKRLMYVFLVFIMAYLFSVSASNPLTLQLLNLNNQGTLYTLVEPMIFIIAFRMITDLLLRLYEDKNLPIQRCAQVKFLDRRLHVVYGVIFVFSIGLFFIDSALSFAILLVVTRIFFEFFDIKKRKFVFLDI